MSLLIESIKILNGRIYNLQRHASRMQRSRMALLQKDISPIDLRSHVVVPDKMRIGLVKCRLVYGECVEEITFKPYEAQVSNTIKLVTHNDIDYQYKYSNRNLINDLYAAKGDCDDIIIVKNNMLTDSSYSNIALLQDGAWYTPATCLLAGTRRQQLIEQGRLQVVDISVDDLKNYEKVSLINAMMGLNQVTIPIHSIDSSMIHYQRQ